MEPITVATAYATIVSLISIFKQERQAQRQATKDEFIHWLDEHRHSETIEYIGKNTSLCKAIESLLQQNHEIVLEQLEAINKQLIYISSKVGGFDQIASAINPSCQLSDQAISLLRQLDDTQADGMLKIESAETLLMPLSGRKSIEVDEQRFLEDDLNVLVLSGLLNLGYNSSGKELYRITRQAVDLIQLINNKYNNDKTE